MASEHEAGGVAGASLVLVDRARGGRNRRVRMVAGIAPEPTRARRSREALRSRERRVEGRFRGYWRTPLNGVLPIMVSYSPFMSFPLTAAANETGKVPIGVDT